MDLVRNPRSTSGVQRSEQPAADRSPAPVGRQKRLYLWTKRTTDVLLSFLGLVLLSPLLLLLALLVKLDSPGPALFAQERVGYDWRRRRETRFRMYKFRSMYHNCDQTPHQEHISSMIQGRGSAGREGDSRDCLTKLTHDKRITRIGRLIRKTSLDELPQLINVLTGDMSLVGPRPVPAYEVALYKPWQRRRLEATPGITGLWQIRGRGLTDIDGQVRLDIEYIERQSLWLDATIIIGTIPAVLSGRGAV